MTPASIDLIERVCYYPLSIAWLLVHPPNENHNDPGGVINVLKKKQYGKFLTEPVMDMIKVACSPSTQEAVLIRFWFFTFLVHEFSFRNLIRQSITNEKRKERFMDYVCAVTHKHLAVRNFAFTENNIECVLDRFTTECCMRWVTGLEENSEKYQKAPDEVAPYTGHRRSKSRKRKTVKNIKKLAAELQQITKTAKK